MKSFTAATALAATLVALATPAFADEMAGPHTPLECTAASASATMNATATVDGKTVALHCVPATMMMPHAMQMKMIGHVAAKTRSIGPNIDGLITPAQIDAAWAKWDYNLFKISVPSP